MMMKQQQRQQPQQQQDVAVRSILSSTSSTTKKNSIQFLAVVFLSFMMPVLLMQAVASSETLVVDNHHHHEIDSSSSSSALWISHDDKYNNSTMIARRYEEESKHKVERILQNNQLPIQTPFRINCGYIKNKANTPSYIDDSTNELWYKDLYYIDDDTTIGDICINNNQLSILFPSSSILYDMYCRIRNTLNTIIYKIPITTNREYYIKLYFFEYLMTNSNTRLFHIYIDGILVSENVDLIKEFGNNSNNMGTLLFGPIYGNQNGLLNIQLHSVKSRAIISGIEITSAQPNPTTLVPTLSPVSPAPITRAPITRSPITSAPRTLPPRTLAPRTSAPIQISLITPTLSPLTRSPILQPTIAQTIPINTNLEPTTSSSQQTNPIFLPTAVTTPIATQTTPVFVVVTPTSVTTPTFTDMRVPSIPSLVVPTTTTTNTDPIFTTPVFTTPTGIATNPILTSPATTPTIVTSPAATGPVISTPTIPSATTPTVIVPTVPTMNTNPATINGASPTTIAGPAITTPVVTTPNMSPATSPVIVPVVPSVPSNTIITTPTTITSPVTNNNNIASPTTNNNANSVPVVQPTNTNTNATAPTTYIVAPSSPTQPGMSTPSSAISPTNTMNGTSIFLPLPIRMKCGMALVSNISSTTPFYVDSFQHNWVSERYLVDPLNTTTIVTVPSTQSIKNTFDDIIYQSVRTGPSFGYEIPISTMGEYDITIHMVELFYNQSNDRIFTIIVEGEIVTDIDIYKKASGNKFSRYTIDFQKSIDDGMLSIQLVSPQYNESISNGLPVICGIEIKRTGPHMTHAVSNGPYTAIDRNDIGFANVNVDASNSHTHGQGLTINQVVWTEGKVVLAQGRNRLVTSFNMSVGEHEVTLMIQDTGGSVSYDQTIITVNPVGFPSITNIIPRNGTLSGMETIMITGTGFRNNSMTIQFGDFVLPNDRVIFINTTTIRVITPASLTAKDVIIRVTNTLGTSGERAIFSYIVPTIPIVFQPFNVLRLSKVVSCAFGPDKFLYMGTTDGKLGRYLIDFLSPRKPIVRTSFLQQLISTERIIVGIAFDPMETNYQFPKVYFSSSDLFHGSRFSSSGASINGKVSMVTTTASSFTNLVDIITGLPVSDHDHAVNSIVFGNNGELYISVGGNTNGGRPGKLSTSGLQKEGYLSASIVRANLRDPNFNGTIVYTADDDGDMIANGIEVFANGIRNAFGLTLHSNGNLYATDNGPNVQYGNMLTGCGPAEFIGDRTDMDKLLLVKQGAYYGHPNPKRAVFHKDPRQCRWIPTTADNTVVGYTPPIAILPSSMNGITEYTANYFAGRLRGNLIVAKYGDELFRFALTPDGNDVVAESKTGIVFPGTDRALALTVAPDGSICEARYSSGTLVAQRPIEPASTTMRVVSVFPFRGPSTGGNVLTIYGFNFKAPVSVTAGSLSCTNVKVVSTRQVDCTLPGGTPGLINVIITQSTTRSEFSQGYRYITGLPQAL